VVCGVALKIDKGGSVGDDVLHILDVCSEILKKKQTEQAGEEKREKQKGKAMELSSEGRQVKKGQKNQKSKPTIKTQRPKTHGRLTAESSHWV
jgi:hypothetical protein